MTVVEAYYTPQPIKENNMRDLRAIELVAENLKRECKCDDPGCELEDLMPLLKSYLYNSNPTCQEIIDAEGVSSLIIDYLYTEYPGPLADPEREKLVLEAAALCGQVTFGVTRMFNDILVQEARDITLSEYRRLFPGNQPSLEKVMFLSATPALRDVYRILHKSYVVPFREQRDEETLVAPLWVYEILASRHSGSFDNSSEYLQPLDWPKSDAAVQLMNSPSFDRLTLREVHRLVSLL